MNKQKQYQTNLFFDYKVGVIELSKQVKKYLPNTTEDPALINAIAISISNFIDLPKEHKYILGFSGGKDSHVLLALYHLYLKMGYEPLNVKVRFADTGLEHHSLYKVIREAQKFTQEVVGLELEIVKGKTSFWATQYQIGYPVPHHFNRWCVNQLKITPMQTNRKKYKVITGRHLGESNSRDNKLKKQMCGGGSCGDNFTKEKYDPMIHWRNCQVWDSIFFFDGDLLYSGVFELLSNQYELTKSGKEGSLRMGCIHCPVVGIGTIEENYQMGLIDEKAFKVRLHLEKLRQARRIKNPRTKKPGAIFVDDRRISWEHLDKQYLLENEWIEESDLNSISLNLQSDYSYPPLYKKEWIEQQHTLLKNDPQYIEFSPEILV